METITLPHGVWAAIKAVLKGETTPRTPGEWQAFLNTLDAAKVEQEEKPE